jgi:hypothetical protein
MKSDYVGAAMSNEVPTSGAKTSNPGASKAAISFHYNLGNEFFRLFLDRECCYSCAMYDEASESLERAQERKLEYHIQQARATGADRVLDIGCGWGALQKRLVNMHGVRLVVGLTLSENQADWIRSMGLPGVEVRIEKPSLSGKVEGSFPHTVAGPCRLFTGFPVYALAGTRSDQQIFRSAHLSLPTTNVKLEVQLRQPT